MKIIIPKRTSDVQIVIKYDINSTDFRRDINNESLKQKFSYNMVLLMELSFSHVK